MRNYPDFQRKYKKAGHDFERLWHNRTHFHAVPYAMYMSEMARDMGYSNSDLKVRIGLFGSEGCTPELRNRIEAGFGLFSTDNYGLSEVMGPGVSGECIERSGLHIAEDHFSARGDQQHDRRKARLRGDGRTCSKQR